MNVNRRRFDVTTVRGPVGAERVCLVYRRINDLIRVVFPTPGGPTTATIIGGASSGSLSTRGTWSRFSLTSWERAACFCSLPGPAYAKAFGFGPVGGQLDFMEGNGVGCLPPECGFFSLVLRCALLAWSSMLALCFDLRELAEIFGLWPGK